MVKPVEKSVSNYVIHQIEAQKYAIQNYYQKRLEKTDNFEAAARAAMNYGMGLANNLRTLVADQPQLRNRVLTYSEIKEIVSNISIGKSIPSPNSEYESFKNAAMRFYEVMPKDSKIKTDYVKNGSRDEYFAEIDGNNDFYFIVKSEPGPDTNPDIIANVSIPLTETAEPFYFREDITDLKREQNYLDRWVDYAIYNYNLQHSPVTLKSLFNNTRLKVYGDEHEAYSELREVQFFLNGATVLKNSKIVIYKFRHIASQNKYRSFSYALSVIDEMCPRFTIFFLRIVGLDSGGAKMYYDEIERHISECPRPVDVKLIDIDYFELEKFLKQNVYTFNTPDTSEIKFRPQIPSEHVFGSKFCDDYDICINHYEDRLYSHAFKDLRNLIDRALKTACEKNNLKPKIKIHEICKQLIGKKILPEHLSNWLRSYTPIGNDATHGNDFSIDTDVRQQQMLFLLGTEIIACIQECLDAEEY